MVTLQTQRVALTTELAGRTSALLVAEVRPQVGGIIQKRLFEEGSDVKTGQVLYQIDPATYRASYDNAKAALDKARATLASVKLKAERYKELVQIKAVSQQDYDDADASLKQADADVAAAQAEQNSAAINLAYTRVTAPISGRIGKSSVTQGALATASQTTALATIQKLDTIYVDLTQSSTDALRLRRALDSGRLQRSGKDLATVKLLLEDGSVYAQNGQLQFTDVSVNEGTGSIGLRAVFPNPKHELMPGMYVRAVLEEGVDQHALLVPQRAVTRNAKGQAVALVVNEQGKVEQRQLTTARALGDQWLVSEGLSAGDRVIVEGTQKARVGAQVTVVPTAQNLKAADSTPAAEGRS